MTKEQTIIRFCIFQPLDYISLCIIYIYIYLYTHVLMIYECITKWNERRKRSDDSLQNYYIFSNSSRENFNGRAMTVISSEKRENIWISGEIRYSLN